MVQTFRCTPLTFQQSEFEYDILRNISIVSMLDYRDTHQKPPETRQGEFPDLLLTNIFWKKPFCSKKKWFLKGFHIIHYWQTIPPVDLYLISEKSIWKNQVRRNGFLVDFELDFYCLCSLQKSILKLIFAVCRTWFLRLDFSKITYRSTGG